MTFFCYVRGIDLLFGFFWSSCMSLAKPQGYTLMQGNLLFILVELETVLSTVSSKILVFLKAASLSNTLVSPSVPTSFLLANFPLPALT
jgi:hypothetical protein